MEQRPWGTYTIIESTPNYKIKRIEVFPNQRLSYQYHKHRRETWVITQGIAYVTLDGFSGINVAGDTIEIPKLMKHRVENPIDEPLVFIEIQTGESFEEEDIIRIEDDYER